VIRRSLRSLLLIWLLLPLGLFWIASAIASHLMTVRTVDEAYDRSLHASALAISERVTMSEGTPTVDIPPMALELLETESDDRVFYRITFRTGDRPEEFLTGYPDLPSGPAGNDSRPVFADARYRGEPIRLVSLRRTYPTDPQTTVLVQVAETALGRSSLTLDLGLRQLVSQLVLILLAVASVWLGVSRALRPLTALSRELTHRSAADLTPLHPDEVPREVSPVVVAVNDLMGRIRQAIASQRRIVANASHALRTPLAVLHTQAESALREDDPGAMRRAVVRLRDQCVTTSHLAGQMLALAGAEHPAEQASLATLDLTALARDTCMALVPEALAHDVDLGFEANGPADVRAVDHQVRELIGNLVDNAIRYGVPHGTITVSVSRRDDVVCLAVEDNGPGIPAAERVRVLEPFHRLPGSAGDGAGLGLAIVREIARRHGGTLDLLDGAGGHGLRVEARFPTVSPTAGRSASGITVEQPAPP
jgi:two-component system sensor histidine kinase TctE